MRRAAVVARLAWRETRASRRRLALFATAISVGVAALVAIASFTANIEESVRAQARELLGGDLVLGSRRPFTAPVNSILDSLRLAGHRVARQVRFASMGYVSTGAGARLVDVHAVSPEYPLYGAVVTSPAGRWGRLAEGRVAVVDTALLVSLDAEIGDSLQIGTKRFEIVAAANPVQGTGGGMAGLDIRVYIPFREAGGTGVIVFGSRVQHTAFVQFPDERSARRALISGTRIFDRERVNRQTAWDFESEVTDALRDLSSFLQFVGLVALLLGGIGVASGIGAFVAGKLENIAVLRCLGATRPLVFAAYLVQAAGLGLAGAAFGAGLGLGLQALLPRVLRGTLPLDVRVTLEPSAVLEGLGIGLAVALLFALRPLLEVRRVSPLQALRKVWDADDPAATPRDPWRLAAFGVLVVGVFLIAMSRAEDPRVGVGFGVAIGISVGMLVLAARVAVWLARRLSRLGGLAARSPYVVRQGLANLHRPRNQTRAVVTALGFGVTVLATLYLVQTNLLRQVDLAQLRAGGRPNLVFVDIQPDQEEGVAAIVREAGLPVIQQVPIVPMRVEALKGMTAEEAGRLPPDRRPASWTLRREYRSTFRDTVNAAETLVRGAWWGPAVSGPPWPVSISTEIAEELRIGVGDSITWNVQGQMVESRVASIREVDWARLETNFFAVFPTRALERAPRMTVVLTRADAAADRARVQRAVAERYTNVTAYDVALLQRTIENIFSRIALGIRFVAALSLTTGVLVLFGAVAAGRLQRIREGALLKTLGATRRQLTRILLAEYLALGALAGLVGIGLAVAGGWAMTRWVFELDYAVPVPPLAAVFLVTAALVALVGMAASREVFRRTAMEVLRDV